VFNGRTRNQRINKKIENVNSFSDLLYLVYIIPENDLLYLLLETTINKTKVLIEKECY